MRGDGLEAEAELGRHLECLVALGASGRGKAHYRDFNAGAGTRVPFIGSKRSKVLKTSSRRQGGEDRGTRPAVGCVRHGRRTGHGTGTAGGRRVAKRDLPCDLVRRGSVGDRLSAPWPS
jgi:hypothetical protein